MRADFWDRYSRGTTICHRWPSGVKLVLAGIITIIALSTPGELWPLLGVLFCLLFVLLSLAQIPLRYLWHRWLGFLPVMLALTLAIPAGNGFQSGWDLVAQFAGRGLVTFTAGIWLVNVIPFDHILQILRRCGLPVVLVAILAFMYRYSYVIFDELTRLQTARRARDFGRSQWWRRWSDLGQILGMLLIRSLNRAERVHGAMCSRGWTGEIHSLEENPRD